MPRTSLKTTTAILAALSFLQPLPALTQSPPGTSAGESGAVMGQGARIERANILSFKKICDDAGILDAEACELHILDLQTAAEAEAKVVADAAAQSAAEAEAAAQAAATADAAGKAAAEAEAAEKARIATEAAAQASEAANLAAHIAAEAEAAATAVAEAEAATQAATEAEAAAKAAAEAEAAAQAATATEAAEKATTEAEARPEAQAGQALAPTTAQTPPQSQRAQEAEDCAAQIVGPDGTIRCVEALTSETIDAIGTETGALAAAPAEVTTETVTEGTRRSSSEEFVDRRPVGQADSAGTGGPVATAPTIAEADSGMSDLEKAGLFVLGAVVVGAILSGGQRVEANTGDRVIVVDGDGDYRVLKDDDALLRQPGSEVRTERFSDGSTRTTLTSDDGTRIITIRDPTGRALRRVRINPDGREYLLIDDTRTFEPVIVRDLPQPVLEDFDYRDATDNESLRQALLAADRRDIGRSFSLRQVREYVEVRALAPQINLEAITFATNSAALQPSQAETLRRMGLLMRDLIADDPTELFLVEGHTDAVGNAGYNLLLSDRRAESVALAFSEYFGVPAENMVVQGYGESYLRVITDEAERRNRRVAVRRITALVR